VPGQLSAAAAGFGEGGIRCAYMRRWNWGLGSSALGSCSECRGSVKSIPWRAGAVSAESWSGVWSRRFCLLPPTLLMGATLRRWRDGWRPHGKGFRGSDFFTRAILPGRFGCLLAGFYLLRVHDLATGTYVAAGINGSVALIALELASRTSCKAERRDGRARIGLGGGILARCMLPSVCPAWRRWGRRWFGRGFWR